MTQDSTSQQGNVLFPWRLHEMLRDCENQGRDDIVSWLPHNKAFKVYKVTEFVGQILPQYFKQTKYKSFQRQLNLWGFERITENGAEKGAYFHKNFLRDQPDLCRLLTRQRASKKSSQQAKQSSSPTKQVNGPSVKKSDVSSSSTSNLFALSFTSTAGEIPNLVVENDDATTAKFDQELVSKLLDEEEVIATAEPVSATTSTTTTCAVSFEGCTFFPLERERYEELTRQVTKYTTTTTGSTPQPQKFDKEDDLLLEIERRTPGLTNRRNSFIPGIHASTQFCAAAV